MPIDSPAVQRLQSHWGFSSLHILRPMEGISSRVHYLPTILHIKSRMLIITVRTTILHIPSITPETALATSSVAKGSKKHNAFGEGGGFRKTNERRPGLKTLLLFINYRRLFEKGASSQAHASSLLPSTRGAQEQSPWRRDTRVQVDPSRIEITLREVSLACRF